MITDAQKRIAESIGVPVGRRHIFLCCDQANPKCCDRDRGLEAWDFLKKRLKELGLSDRGGVLRTKAQGESTWDVVQVVADELVLGCEEGILAKLDWAKKWLATVSPLSLASAVEPSGLRPPKLRGIASRQ